MSELALKSPKNIKSSFENYLTNFVFIGRSGLMLFDDEPDARVVENINEWVVVKPISLVTGRMAKQMFQVNVISKGDKGGGALEMSGLMHQKEGDSFPMYDLTDPQSPIPVGCVYIKSVKSGNMFKHGELNMISITVDLEWKF